MTAEGRYLYCVTEGEGDAYGKIGLSGKDVFAVSHKDIAAVVSAIPFKTIESTLAWSRARAISTACSTVYRCRMACMPSRRVTSEM